MKTEKNIYELSEEWRSIYEKMEPLKYEPEVINSFPLERQCLKHILQIKDETMCLAAVREDGLALEFVTDELKTKDLCLEAVRQDGEALEYVPDGLKTAELCLEAVKQNGWALASVPDELKTEELCLEAVKQNGSAIEFVPVESKPLIIDEISVHNHQDIKPKLSHRSLLRWDIQKRTLISEDEKYRSFYHYMIE